MPAKKKLQIRPLRSSEVTFTVELEPEDIEVRGNVMCSDDPEFDRQCEDEIIERLDRGDIEAWCYVRVTASWEGISEFAGLGCCSFESGSGERVRKQVDQCVEEHGLKAEALAALNQEVERQALQCLDRIRKLSTR